MRRKILIIDDERDIVRYLNAVLEENGYDCYIAHDAVTGFALAQAQNPDLICLDIMMPGESGVSFYIKLRSDARLCNVPVFFVSGMVKEMEYDFRNLVPDTEIPGPRRYIEKPIDVNMFIQMVHEEIGPSSTTNKNSSQAQPHE